MTFRILWGIDALISLVWVYYFVIGIADGSVSSFNIVLWLGIFAALAGILWGSRMLRTAGRTGLAHALLLLLAVPGVIAGLLLLVLFISEPSWN